MHLILTHEQADFDAVGALLGAYLMSERAIPVLPYRVNRNVRAYLTLYGEELPFVEARDLPAEEIETLTLVDTQSLVTVKGITRRTSIHIYDHHPRRTTLPDEWNITLNNVGACTSMFIQELWERDVFLSPVQATLLLTGIYEDTGSLTSTNTTSEDARAVSYLLEMGASLKIATQYLNPPLSANQKILYERLIKSIETLSINGQKVTIAFSEAIDITDEISTVAHKLCDTLDLETLFLIVHTQEGIRMIARSNSVNVAAPVIHFGGGGHPHAAATLIRLNPDEVPLIKMKSTRDKLIEILHSQLKPPITVGQIMSSQPLLLSPETSTQEAYNLMQRYGYEGYPVVRDSQVIGLLTRRAVDRAISHKLNLTAASLMEAGEVTVQPEDSLEHLQTVMIESGWGQIPVINPENHEIIGIVTRTDLLKTLTDLSPLPGHINLATKLNKALPPSRLALLQIIARQARELHQAVYIVGGFVRDLMLDRPSPDFDIVVEGDAILLAKNLSNTFGGRIVSHSRFGTARWFLDPVPDGLENALKRLHLTVESKKQPNISLDLPDGLDLISARTEFYDYPTALPTVERSNIKLDLHRRDFTINTMALRLDGRHYGDLYDFWGGRRDLRRGLVRVLHSLSFVDDPTRLLRAVRFEQRFGFKIEERTRELMNQAREMIRQVSGDRLRHELYLILDEPQAIAMLARLEELGLLHAIHPALSWNPDRTAALQRALREPLASGWNLPTQIGGVPIRRLLAILAWLLYIPAEQIVSVCQRLRFGATIQDCLLNASRLVLDIPSLSSSRPSQVVDRLDNIPLPTLYTLAHLDGNRTLHNVIDNYILKWRHVHPYTTGDTLRGLGIPPGPVYRTILGTLRARWLDGDIQDAQQEEKQLTEILQKMDLK
ncbi:MAG TPA: CBS domain-containing protein [Anaerolineaceae bacterium]